MTRILFSLIILISSSALATYSDSLKKITLNKEKDSLKLEKLFKANWEYSMKSYPEWATYVGYPGNNSKWTDNSLSAIEQRKQDKKQTLKAIQSISRKNLPPRQWTSYDLFLKASQDEVEGLQFPEEYLALNQMSGLQTNIAEMMWAAPKNTLADYRDMLERLNSTPTLTEQTQILLQKGLDSGITQPQIVLQGVTKQFDEVLKAKIEESPLYLPFAEMNSKWTQSDRQKIQSEAKEIVEKQAYPALKKFRDFFVNTYLPKARTTTGFSDLPNGKEWYAFRARYHTTVKMTPDEIHQLGLNEVSRIHNEMEKIKTQVGFKGSLAKFNDFLKSDKQFFYTDSKDLMIGFRDISKSIDPELPKLFKTLPRLPYGIREMPAYKAPDAPTAYYQGGSLETGRAGYFEANTFNLKARPKWQMEALTLHEAVPGHHLQISLAQELTGLPEFQKNSGPTAFVEGWGLYAESLGEELGLYKDPYSKYGQLTFEIWRAIRLVVDTGIHIKGWSRDKVIQYFKENSPISEQQILNETDRYIADPGQALAYKIGELKFKEIRTKAAKTLGENFSIREFHDELLNEGALPMEIVEKKMDGWIQSKVKTSLRPILKQ